MGKFFFHEHDHRRHCHVRKPKPVVLKKEIKKTIFVKVDWEPVIKKVHKEKHVSCHKIHKQHHHFKKRHHKRCHCRDHFGGDMY
ncbi:hypothetical protein [Paenibacillus sp. OAE614]|uniref:hypothetical protein n=1 Tax=Paenibacillus sp. OAE614 TaxID=2663804 RepID=UPI00178A545F